jgi:hypothetical protein
MAEPTTTGTGAAQPAAITNARVVETPQGAFPVHRSWKIALIVAIGMALLALTRLTRGQTQSVTVGS